MPQEYFNRPNPTTCPRVLGSGFDAPHSIFLLINLNPVLRQAFIVLRKSDNVNENDAISEQLVSFTRKERKKYCENVLFKFPTESLELEQSDFNLDLTLIIDELAQLAGQFKMDFVLAEHMKLVQETNANIQYLSRRNLELKQQLETLTTANLDSCEKLIDLRVEMSGREASDTKCKMLRW